jgi:hypothetical protein
MSQVPTALRVPALLICGTEDASFDAMARAARVGDLALVSLAGADHMDGFLSGQAPRLIDDSFATSAEPTVPTLATNAAAVVSVDTAPRHTGPGDSPSAAPRRRRRTRIPDGLQLRLSVASWPAARGACGRHPRPGLSACS